MRGIFLTNTVLRVCQDEGKGLSKSVVKVLDRSENPSNETAKEMFEKVSQRPTITYALLWVISN